MYCHGSDVGIILAVIRLEGEGVIARGVEVRRIGQHRPPLRGGYYRAAFAGRSDDAEGEYISFHVIGKLLHQRANRSVFVSAQSDIDHHRRVVNRRHGNLYGCCLCGMAVCNRIREGI